MANPRPEGEKIIKYTRNLFRLKKEVKGIEDILYLEILRIFLSMRKRRKLL